MIKGKFSKIKLASDLIEIHTHLRQAGRKPRRKPLHLLKMFRAGRRDSRIGMAVAYIKIPERLVEEVKLHLLPLFLPLRRHEEKLSFPIETEELIIRNIIS